MYEILFAAAENDGSALGGFIILMGLLWIGYAICKGPKPKGYNIRSETKASITPRK